MATKYIIDTHALIWYLEGNARLGAQAKKAMSMANNQLVLPLIALAEAAFLIERRRIGIPNVSGLLSDVLQDKRIEITPLSWDIFERSLTPEAMSIPELHDRFIVSTGLHLQDLGHTVQIITKDALIREANVLPILW